jgi:hypothetical protein
MTETECKVVHDSMGFNAPKIREMRGVKLGQKVTYSGNHPANQEVKTIKHITPAGEVIFDDGTWDYVDAINGTNPDL